MKLLLIGGPSFIGLHTIEQALARGHQVTMFNRGQTNPHLYPEVERLRGDRKSRDDLAVLRGREWDVVVDTCGYDHRVVALTLEALEGSVRHYTFIASTSVYADYRAPRREDDPKDQLIGDPDVPMTRSYGGSAHYGPLKVLCEAEVAKAFPNSSVMIRLTLGVGPNDHGNSTHRLAYWAQRVRDVRRQRLAGGRGRAAQHRGALVDPRRGPQVPLRGGRQQGHRRRPPDQAIRRDHPRLRGVGGCSPRGRGRTGHRGQAADGGFERPPACVSDQGQGTGAH